MAASFTEIPDDPFATVERAFVRAVEEGVFPGAALLVAREGDIVCERVFGFRSWIPEKRPVTESTLFDLASLTKPLATTTALMLSIAERKVGLDEAVSLDDASVTVRRLLAHSSGLPAWKPYYEEVLRIDQARGGGFMGSAEAKQFVYDKARHEGLVFEPGSKTLYSDLGFMLLGELVEKLSGQSLERFCRESIFDPLGMRSTRFFEISEPKPDLDVAATQNCPWRGKVLQAEVDDDNACAMGGVAGHAGLFSNVRDIHRLLSRLRLCYLGKDDFVPPALIRLFFERQEPGSFALGWDTPAANDSSSGRRFSARSVGHLGFTGTSIWWDLAKDCYIVLLSNRVHPSRENEKIKQFRPFVHDLIMTGLGL